MNDFLAKKCQQNMELEEKIDELEDAYRNLADNVEKPTLDYQQRIQTLENNFSTMTTLYQVSSEKFAKVSI